MKYREKMGGVVGGWWKVKENRSDIMTKINVRYVKGPSKPYLPRVIKKSAQSSEEPSE
jgi:hypothetical protein